MRTSPYFFLPRPQPYFASKKAKKQYYDAVCLSRIRESDALPFKECLRCVRQPGLYLTKLSSIIITYVLLRNKKINISTQPLDTLNILPQPQPLQPPLLNF